MATSREEQFKEFFPNEPSFRVKQAVAAVFNFNAGGWEDITNLPKGTREEMSKKIPWMSLKEMKILKGKNGDVFKAMLDTLDEKHLETAIMKNAREDWTICMSSQIGCLMGCLFCATGISGLKRHLTSDEIVDQYRFWRIFLKKQKLARRISNIVFMGMGEPMLNYKNVKQAIKTILEFTDVGPTKIIVSTSVILQQMENLLQDEDWPPVRIAISLHAPNYEKRKKLMPKTPPDFYKRLLDWSKRYRASRSRRQYLTFEYLLLNEINDSQKDARELANFVLKTGLNKINLIPFNPIPGKSLSQSNENAVLDFKSELLKRGLDVTTRKSLGEDISAACGQLTGEI